MKFQQKVNEEEIIAAVMLFRATRYDIIDMTLSFLAYQMSINLHQEVDQAIWEQSYDGETTKQSRAKTLQQYTILLFCSIKFILGLKSEV